MKLFIPRILIILSLFFFTNQLSAQKFQGKAYYFSKSKMELGSW